MEMRNLDHKQHKCRLIVIGILTVLCAFGGICNAQNFKILPGLEINVKGKSSEEQIIGEAKFVNTSNSKKTYQWYRTKNVPSGWIITTCVPGKCYSADKDSGYFVLEAGKEGILDQNFFPVAVSGQGSVEFFIFEKNKKDQVVKVVYYAEVLAVKE